MEVGEMIAEISHGISKVRRESGTVYNKCFIRRLTNISGS